MSTIWWKRETTTERLRKEKRKQKTCKDSDGWMSEGVEEIKRCTTMGRAEQSSLPDLEGQLITNIVEIIKGGEEHAGLVLITVTKNVCVVLVQCDYELIWSNWFCV